jgi:site-specific DNA-methyltransferase (adenine-specific)/modification methylase
MIELNRIYQMDCLDGLKEIEDKCINLTLTDPPYNVKLKSSISLTGRKAMYEDFNKMDWDKLNIRELYDSVFPHLDRITKSDGSVLMFCRLEWITYLIESANKNNFDVKATIIWHKTNPMPQVRKRNYLSSTEAIVWVARWDKDKCLFKFNFGTQNDMHNFFESPICMGLERTEHPTQKPLDLIKKLLEIHSDRGDLILDPFIGSGTTAVACKLTGRRFIGFELEKEYIDIANRRLNNLKYESLYVSDKKNVLDKSNSTQSIDDFL